MSPGQTRFGDDAQGRKSSRFPALEVLPPTVVFPQEQEPWIAFARPHGRCQPGTQPLAQLAMELHVAKTRCGVFGVGAYHFPKLS